MSNLRYKAVKLCTGEWGVLYERPHRHCNVLVVAGMPEESAKAEAKRLSREAELSQARLDVERAREGRPVVSGFYSDNE